MKMTMKMKSKLLYIPMAMVVMSALVGLTSTTTTTKTTTTRRWTTTTGASGLNLNGKMFTLSLNRGGISFYSPYFSPTTPPYPTRRYTTRPYYTTSRPYYTTTRPYYTTTRPYYTTTRPYTPRTTTTRPYYTTTRPYYTTTRPYYTTTRPYYTTTPPYTPRTTTTRPYYTTTPPYTPRTTTTRPYYTTTRPYYTSTRPYTPQTTSTHPYTPQTTTTPPWTTAPPTRGVSVCLRYLSDYLAAIPTIFTLSPSSGRPLQMGVSSSVYRLSFDRYGYSNMYLRPFKRFSSNIGLEIWTRVCLTMDTRKNVAQLFSDSSMSIRKMLPTNVQYVWSGEPVIDFSGFDGQVTDVQIWDYPLQYREVFNYMIGGGYGSYSGSALTWSYISYTPRGSVLLEDIRDVYEPQWQDRQPINRSRERKGRRPKGEKKTREFFNWTERKREQL